MLKNINDSKNLINQTQLTKLHLEMSTGRDGVGDATARSRPAPYPIPRPYQFCRGEQSRDFGGSGSLRENILRF